MPKSAINLHSKPVVERIHSDISTRVQNLIQKTGRPPKLAVVLVGQDPASVLYTKKKGEAAISLGILHESVVFPASVNPKDVQATIARLNSDPSVDGILIQRPLPPSFNEEEVLYWVSLEKDVDAFHPENTGRLALGLPCFRPCTPTGVMEILKHYKIDPARKIACVIGRSSIVGKPMASLLLQANATVIQTHSQTPDLKSLCRQADLVVAALGKPHSINAGFIKPGAVVIDVGISRLPSGKISGDVAFDEVSKIASAITPVPGGVGPTTIAILLQNTVWAAERRLKQSSPPR